MTDHPRANGLKNLIQNGDFIDLDVGEANPRSIFDYTVVLSTTQSIITTFEIYTRTEPGYDWNYVDSFTIAIGSTTASSVRYNGFRYIRIKLTSSITGHARVAVSQ